MKAKDITSQLTGKEVLTLAIIAAMFASSLLMLPSMPGEVPVHWNAEGEVDGHGPPESTFLIPVVALFVYGLFLAIPLIAVNKKNVLGFYKLHGFSFKLAMTLFFGALHAVILLSALGTEVPMGLFMPLMVGGLFVYLGHVMPDVKRNYFIGIRTPWALADDRTWEKTHEFGGKAFMIGGAFFALWGVFGGSILVPVAVVLFLVLSAVVYSYKVFREK